MAAAGSARLLEGKVCIVTGSTGGIGLGIAKHFLQHGAFVYLNGRSNQSLETVSSALSQLGFKPSENFVGIAADLGTKDGVAALIQQVDRPVDVLVNNMGIFSVMDFFEADDEAWQTFYETNVMSTVRLSRKYLKDMLARDTPARIINVSSECGVRPIPHMLPYSVSKGSQIVFTRGLAELTKGTKVTVNSLLPGPTWTEGVAKFLEGIAVKDGVTVEEAQKQYFITNEPSSLLQRFLTVEEVANVALFLASDLSSGINGHAQHVEGGIIRHI